VRVLEDCSDWMVVARIEKLALRGSETREGAHKLPTLDRRDPGRQR